MIEGDWENGILTLSVDQYVELENGEFYMNELQSSGLFGCSHNWIHYPLSDMMSHCMKRTIRKEEEWSSILPYTVNSICVAKNCCNEMKGDLEISNYPYLKSLEVKKNSLKNLNSLKFSDNPVLKSIKTEHGAFNNVKNVTITSTLIYD